MELSSEEAAGKDLRHREPAVVFTADEDYALPLAAAIQSLLANLQGGQGIEVYVLHPGLSVATKARLRRVAQAADCSVTLSFHQIDADRHFGHLDLQFYERFSETIYFRLLMGEVLPDRHRKVLYLDSDVVVEDNVLELWTRDLEGNILLAAQERTVSCPNYGVHNWEELGLDPEAPYFNSGVMFIDMEKWHSQEVGARVLDYLHRNRNGLNVRGNQEGLNAVLAGQWKPLPQRWNVLHWYYDPDLFAEFHHGPVPKQSNLPSLTRYPSLIHFTSSPKPWEPGSRHPARDRFYHYLRESGWFSGAEYLQWRTRLAVQSVIQRFKDVSRPYRHKIGLKRS